LIEDIQAQAHMIVDMLTFDSGTIALSALRTLGDSPKQGGPFAQLLGMEFHEMSDGRCAASLEVKEHLLNPLGIAHGGVAYSLADSTCGGATLSALGSARMVTQDMQMRYHGPARQGRIVAKAEVIHHGQRTVTTQCQVTQENMLIASCTATFAILSDQEVSALESSSPG
jgi:acyl-CoA thioesterase